MTIDAIACIRGYGPVALGTVQDGTIGPGQAVTIMRNGVAVKESTVDAVQNFWQSQPIAAGQTVGLLLRLAPSQAATMRLDDGNTILSGKPGSKSAPTSVADQPFHMTVSGVTSIPGRGTLISGVVDSGMLRAPQDVVLFRSGAPVLSTSVAAIEGLNSGLREATACDEVAILVRGISPDRVRVGDVLTTQVALSTGGATGDQPAIEPSTSTPPRERGTVKWFNNQKGYGFITRKSGQDAYVHFSQIQGEGVKTLNQGEQVEFSVVQTNKGPTAVEVERVR